MWERVKKARRSPCSITLAGLRKAARRFWTKNGLLTLSLFSVVSGCLVGFGLRRLALTDLEKQYLSFPGELLMRMLKMLILPLITSSLMSGLATMDSRVCRKMGLITITYYLWTTFLAVATGIVLVLAIHPGVAAQKEEYTYRTVLVPVAKPSGRSAPPRASLSLIYFVPDAENPAVQRPVLLEITPSPDMAYQTLPGSNNEMNVLGIVIFSATIGFLLGKMGDRGAPLVNVCQSLNEAVMKIVSMAVWYFPLGIIFLIAGKILEMEDPHVIGKKLGLYALTVVIGLSIHSLCFLPLFFGLITRRNPFSFIRGILPALLIALATSSSSATLPITLKCLLENNGVDRRIARFVLPVGATINMDGTALYEAVAAIFIAQVNEYDLDLGQIVTIRAVDSTPTPSLRVLPTGFLSASRSFPRDRLRTMTNVLGDALAAGIIAHICRKDFAPEPPRWEPKKNPPAKPPPSCSKNHVVEVIREALPDGAGYNICQIILGDSEEEKEVGRTPPNIGRRPESPSVFTSGEPGHFGGQRGGERGWEDPTQHRKKTRIAFRIRLWRARSLERVPLPTLDEDARINHTRNRMAARLHGGRRAQLSKSPSLRDLPAHFMVHGQQKITNARENPDMRSWTSRPKIHLLDGSLWAAAPRLSKKRLLGEPQNRNRRKEEESATCHTDFGFLDAGSPALQCTGRLLKGNGKQGRPQETVRVNFCQALCICIPGVSLLWQRSPLSGQKRTSGLKVPRGEVSVTC
ncbi:hypothetical protein JRQ81_008693 [Phrynocephalus forsythii]|uniref:Amino acid transporter n=1 Tax=Phrynocephalus forsythii TaxID=171643 RepID=A0A9Q0XCJ8_9SAUR|nr:hypothetical protein JRQ81_008693 [Phrynocephalus forsythii]